MSENPYTKRVSHTFELRKYDIWEVTDFDTEYIGFEETRKNGQEDTHMGGEANLVDGKWVLDQSTRNQIEMYASEATANALEAFFNEHGTPGEDDG